MEHIREAIKLAKARHAGEQVPVVLASEKQHAPQSHQNPQHQARNEATGPAESALYGVSPRILEQNRIVAHQADNPLTAPFDILRTRLLQDMDKNGFRSLVVTSPTPSCGKTITAINLALSIGRLPERTVVLLDLDLRKPAVSHYLGLSPDKGLSDYLAGNESLLDVAYQIDIGGPHLRIIGNNSAMRNPAEAMSSTQMAELFARIKALPGDPLIIVDTSPILVADDVLILLPLTDCSLLTLAENATTAREIEKSEELLASSNLLGCVLNKSKEKQGTHYY